MGIGYAPLPENVSITEFKNLYREWEQKLADSGFEDIEYRSGQHTGKFLPYFKRNGSTATFQRLYDPSTEEYYALTRSFESYMNKRAWFVEGDKQTCRTRWSYYFNKDRLMYKTLWHLHTEGVPYRAVAKAFGGVQTHWTKNCKPIPPSVARKRSVFWAHTHTHRILVLFWQWAQTQGYDKPNQNTGNVSND